MVFLLCVAAAQDDTPSEPLCRAARDGDLALVRTLLTRGANPNIRDENDDTPLIWVAWAHALSSPDNGIPDYEGVAKLLMESGANVNARDRGGRTALISVMEGSASAYRVVGADDGVARLLIRRGADVNARDKEGWTPLLKALNLWADQPALIEFLVSKGADVNARLNDGRTGLMLAATSRQRRPGLVFDRQGRGCQRARYERCHCVDTGGHDQSDEQSFDMMKLLKENRANLNDMDEHGSTAADRAAQAGFLDRAKFLDEQR